MRGFAFGILDPRGERYRLARLHQRECPACRAYVLSLRGLAAVLPPLPLPWGLAFAGVHHTAPHPTSSPRTPPTHAGVGAKAGAGTGAGTIAASGAAGAGGAASGGWLLGGSVGAKLAVGCVLALSVGCVALSVVPHHAGASTRSRAAPSPARPPWRTPRAPRRRSPALVGSTALGGVHRGALVRGGCPAHLADRARRRGEARRGQARPAGVRPRTARSGDGHRKLIATVRAGDRTRGLGSTAGTRCRGIDCERRRKSTPNSEATPASTPSGPPPSRAEREFGPE